MGVSSNGQMLQVISLVSGRRTTAGGNKEKRLQDDIPAHGM